MGPTDREISALKNFGSTWENRVQESLDADQDDIAVSLRYDEGIGIARHTTAVDAVSLGIIGVAH